MNGSAIAAAEQKLIAAFRYEQRVPAERDKIVLACRLVDAHANKVRKLAAEGAPLSPRVKTILD